MIIKYGYVRGGKTRWNEFSSMAECLRSARRAVMAERKSDIDYDIMIFQYPEGKAGKIFSREYNTFLDDSDRYFVGSVWCTNIYHPQYQPKNVNGYSYDLLPNGALGGIGWMSEEYAKKKAEKLRKTAKMVYGFDAGSKIIETDNIKDALAMLYARSRKTAKIHPNGGTDFGEYYLFKYPKGTTIMHPKSHMMAPHWDNFVIGEIWTLPKEKETQFQKVGSKQVHELKRDGTLGPVLYLSSRAL